MSKVIDNLAISYPVTFYYGVKRYFTVMIGCLIIGMLGYFVIPLAHQDEAWIVVAVGWLLILTSIFGLIICFYAWFQKKPVVIIEEKGFSFFNILKRHQQKKILWQDVVSIDLIPWTHGYITHWMLSVGITSNNLDGIKVIRHPLKPMYLEHVMLNEKEVFYLLEQAFAGDTVLSYQNIKMRLSDRLVMSFGFWLMIVFTITGLVAALFIAIYA
ncbi:STM3941 family protein [Psychrobacter sp. Ps3]|uniref:STM3941 family protein n=1 Tax=Psychrobacter sp. Ps3 TaxID=2790957 RepID=UPI001EE0B191|nr:STM3941 family protein [Psychrobacter sp. Ps3]MCG3882014.1 hypothetical protein [Psychrobacter sp. Ps3]